MAARRLLAVDRPLDRYARFDARGRTLSETALQARSPIAMLSKGMVLRPELSHSRAGVLHPMSIVRSVEESFRTRILPTRWSAAALKRWQAGGDHLGCEVSSVPTGCARPAQTLARQPAHPRACATHGASAPGLG